MSSDPNWQQSKVKLIWVDKKDIKILFLSTQVCLYFHHKLYRGNRVTKVDAGSFNAFNSPNLAPLANAEVDIKSNLKKTF